MKISWSKALADYLRDETQSYASIARKYGVSKQSVVKRAVKEGWQDLRHKTLLEVDQKLTEIVGEDIAIVNARQAQFGRLLQAIALKAIKDNDLKPENFMQALRAVVEGVKIEREAVERMEQHQPLVNIFNKAEIAWQSRYKDDSDKTEELKLAISHSVQQPVQIAPQMPVVSLELLKEIQLKLKNIKDHLDRL